MLNSFISLFDYLSTLSKLNKLYSKEKDWMCDYYSAIFRLESAIPLLLRELPKLSADQPLAIAFPDDGAFKRFNKYFTKFPTIICYKVRDGTKRVVKVKDGESIS